MNLVDARFGLITRLEPYTPGFGMPPSWTGYSARVADTSKFAHWSADRYGFGAAFDDPERARLAALGEAVERYCGNAVPHNLEIASHRELGKAALDPTRLALYSERQYATPGFPFVPFTRDLPVAWVPGQDLHTDTPALLPASLVYLNYFRGPHADEPPTHALPYSGIATGPDRATAETSALEELFERDTTALWWASGATADVITDERLLRIPDEFGIPVIAAFVEREGLLSFGTAARADPAEAARKALVEAYAMFALTTEVATKDSPLWTAVARGEFAGHTFRPYREDRRYRDQFRADLRDIVDLPTLAQLYLDPRMQGEPLDRLRAPGPRINLDDVPAVPGDARTTYLDRLAEAGLGAYSADITTPDVRAAGLTVVRVVVPGLYGNAPAAFPYLGGERLYRTPAKLGWVSRELTEDDLYPYPVPLI